MELGLTRRAFLRTASGMATAFAAMHRQTRGRLLPALCHPPQPPGATALTWIPLGPSAAAKCLTNVSIAPLVAA
jgi:hypothetical protein